MQRRNPKQHSHNWQMKLTKFSKFSPLPTYLEHLKPYSPGGFNTVKYWACVRGGKVKHVLKIFNDVTYKQDVFIAASGSPYLVAHG